MRVVKRIPYEVGKTIHRGRQTNSYITQEEVDRMLSLSEDADSVIGAFWKILIIEQRFSRRR